MDKQKALIVGSTGKLGHAINPILERFFELDYCYKVLFEKSNNRNEIVYCGVSKKYFKLSKYKVIINCSWVAGVSHFSLIQNIKICDLLLNNSSSGVFIYLSSIDVYGVNNIDTYKCQPRTVFAINKMRVERSIFKINSNRNKFILRVGNYISQEQLKCDVISNEFLTNLDWFKNSNLVSPAVLVDKIYQFAISSQNTNKTIVENCVNSPNYTWGEIVESMNRSFRNPSKESVVLVKNSSGVVPFFFNYVNRSGGLSLNYSFLKINIFLILILSRLINKSKKHNNRTKPEEISFFRVYQDYTLR